MVFANLETAGPARVFAARFAREFGEHFSTHLPIQSIVAFDLLGHDPEILYRWGELNLELSEEFIAKLRAVEMPWVGEWADHIAAVFSIGEDRTILISVFLQPSSALDKSTFAAHTLSLFSSLHYTLTHHVKRLELQDAFEQARAIQMSLLPPGSMQFGPYEIAAATIPAHSVGGDVFDFQSLNADTLSIAIGDASGHGLPAALQARDLIIGLRMGLELDHDITQIVRKLNRVIHRSGLASRFASLLSGTLDVSGKFTYVNAGHPHPLLLDSNGFHDLNTSGMILGPYADWDYTSGTALLTPGALLALYTDGVLEHSNSHGKEFGTQEVKHWMIDWQRENVISAMKDLFARLRLFGQGQAFRDDVTAILIRRQPEPGL